MGGGEVGDVHYMSSVLPYIVEEHCDGFQSLDEDSVLARAIHDQETVYQLIELNKGNHMPGASSGITSSYGIGRRQGDGEMGNLELQFAIDEALARSLEQMDTKDENFVPETTGNRERNSTESTSQTVIQDGVDPDTMSYEELQSLGEAIGAQSRGLSEELISYLQTSKYKSGGFFSKNNRHEECVICCMEYKTSDRLITLPCQHQYHAVCVTRWLKMNKVCPVCLAEVFGS